MKQGQRPERRGRRVRYNFRTACIGVFGSLTLGQPATASSLSPAPTIPDQAAKVLDLARHYESEARRGIRDRHNGFDGVDAELSLEPYAARCPGHPNYDETDPNRLDSALVGVPAFRPRLSLMPAGRARREARLPLLSTEWYRADWFTHPGGVVLAMTSETALGLGSPGPSAEPSVLFFLSLAGTLLNTELIWKSPTRPGGRYPLAIAREGETAVLVHGTEHPAGLRIVTLDLKAARTTKERLIESVDEPPRELLIWNQKLFVVGSSRVTRLTLDGRIEKAAHHTVETTSYAEQLAVVKTSNGLLVTNAGPREYGAPTALRWVQGTELDLDLNVVSSLPASDGN